MNFFKITLFAIITSISISCTKEEDNLGPIITINFPKENTVYKYGNSLHTNITFDDKSGIATCRYILEPMTNTGVKFEYQKDISLENFLTTYTANHTISIPTKYDANTNYENDNYKLKIIAEDFENNISTKELTIRIENSEQ